MRLRGPGRSTLEAPPPGTRTLALPVRPPRLSPSKKTHSAAALGPPALSPGVKPKRFLKSRWNCETLL